MRSPHASFRLWKTPILTLLSFAGGPRFGWSAFGWGSCAMSTGIMWSTMRGVEDVLTDLVPARKALDDLKVERARLALGRHVDVDEAREWWAKQRASREAKAV